MGEDDGLDLRGGADVCRRGAGFEEACGVQAGDEAWSDHSAMQRLVLGDRCGVRAARSSGSTAGVAKYHRECASTM